MKKISIILGLCSSVLLSGCVITPLEHEEVAIPIEMKPAQPVYLEAQPAVGQPAQPIYIGTPAVGQPAQPIYHFAQPY